MKRYILVFITWCILATIASADWQDCMDATCRIKVTRTKTYKKRFRTYTKTYSVYGTGCCYKISNGYAHIVTNKHVVGNQKTEVECEFWHKGYLQNSVTGTVVPNGSSFDVVTVTIPLGAFTHVPAAVPFAPDYQSIHKGDTVVTAGCPGADWLSFQVGHIVECTTESAMIFVPQPWPGQSGSAIFDADGEYIIGLIYLYNSELRIGVAVALNAIKQAIPEEPTQFSIYYFYADWCLSCKEQSREIDKLYKEGVMDELKSQGYTFKKVDCTDMDSVKDQLERYEIEVFPTIIAVDYYGIIIHEWNRVVKAEEFERFFLGEPE